MTAKHRILALCLTLAVAACLALTACGDKHPPVPVLPNKQDVRAPKPGVKLGYGDELNVSVWRNDDLSVTVKVDNSGAFTFPLVGQVEASGRTIGEIREDLTQKLSKYLVDPQVSVSPAVLRSQTAIVVGEVKTPGVLTIDHDIAMFEAVGRCGGFTDDADEGAVLLFRDEGDRPSIYLLNMTLGQKLGENTAGFNRYVQDGDVLYVPMSGMASVEQFMVRLDNILRPILNLERFIIFMPQVRDAVDSLIKGQTTLESSTVVQTAGGEVIGNSGGVVPVGQ